MSKKLKMNQVVAITAGEKSRKQSVLSKVYQTFTKLDLFEGFSRRYESLDDEGEKFPNEDKIVQLTVDGALIEAQEVLESMMNIIATQDCGNQLAKADVVINDKVILAGVPATHLIFLEKQLKDVETFVGSIPVLDPAVAWEFSKDAGYFKSAPIVTSKSKKVTKVLTLAQATDKHPAQAQPITEDVKVGDWTTVRFSGNISKERKNALLDKIRNLAQAVKVAREEANLTEVEMKDFGTKVLNHIFK